MVEFKAGDKVVWKDRGYAKARFPALVDSVLTVTKVDDDGINKYLVCEEFSYEYELAERFELYKGDNLMEESPKEQDVVNSPNHYILFRKDEIEGDFIEVKHVVKRILERWQYQDQISFDMYQAGCYKEMLQYLLRAPLKNNIEDVSKAQYYLKEILEEW